jgi:hypothetical protein
LVLQFDLFIYVMRSLKILVDMLFLFFLGADILILARTDARGTDSLDEAIERCRLFRELGADITFLEAPVSGLTAPVTASAHSVLYPCNASLALTCRCHFLGFKLPFLHLDSNYLYQLSVQEMQRYCDEVPGPKMVRILCL